MEGVSRHRCGSGGYYTADSFELGLSPISRSIA